MEAYRAFYIRRGGKHTHTHTHTYLCTLSTRLLSYFFFSVFGVTMNTYRFLQLKKKLKENQMEMNEKKSKTPHSSRKTLLMLEVMDKKVRA
jgi:hypothetical protein